MTNEEIISAAKAENKIDCTVNTYGGWMAEGKKVKKGERAVFKTGIWKPYDYETKDGEKKTKMRKIKAAFFEENQVEEIETTKEGAEK